eukprot:PhF_6_TR31218/c1_g1_i1/m.45768
MFECCVRPSTATSNLSRKEVIVNIYDVSISNAIVGWMGLGVYHTGIEVYGKEYGFGRDTSGTGVFAINPKSYEMHQYRESVSLGRTTFTESEVECLMDALAHEWQCNLYHLTKRNCNDFSEQVAKILLGEEVCAGVWPTWVNQTAKNATAVLPTSWVDYFDSVDKDMFKSTVAVEVAA